MGGWVGGRMSGSENGVWMGGLGKMASRIMVGRMGWGRCLWFKG